MCALLIGIGFYLLLAYLNPIPADWDKADHQAGYDCHSF
jgi:hypothetical protein